VERRARQDVFVVKHLPLIGCTLDTGDQRARYEEWRSLLAQALSRSDVDRGRRYVFARDLTATVQRLAEAEHECCSFLHFDVDEDDASVAMTVTADDEPTVQDALRFVFT
jgi:hypothetical protein